MPQDDDLESTLTSLQGQIGQSPLSQLSPLGQFGAAISPPFFQGLQEQQTNQFRQQVQLLGVQQRIQQQRFERNKILFNLGENFLKVGTPESRAAGAKVISGALGQMNILPQGLTPESLETMLAKQPLDDPTLRAIAQDFEFFQQDSDATIAGRRGVDPKQVTDLRAAWGNKTTRRLLFPSLAAAELKEEEFEALREDRKARLAQEWEKFQESQALKFTIAQMGAEIRRQGITFQREKETEKDLSKRRKQLSSAITLEGINTRLVRALTKMAQAGALPDKPGLFSDVVARIARHTTLKNDPDVSFFMSFGTEQGIGNARTFQGDVGVRSIMPFSAMIHTILNPGPLQSMLPILQQWQTELNIAKQTALSPSLLVGPQEIQELQDFAERLNQLNTQGVQVFGFQEVK